MIRVGIVVFQNLKYAPFLKFYKDFLDEMEEVDYEVIYYNRDYSLKEIQNEKHIAIPWYGKGTNSASKFEKAINFLAYKVSVEKTLKNKKYDFIILLMTMPSILLSNYLIKNYKGKYIVDIRDYTQEHVKLFYKKEQVVVSNSALNIISSPGFKTFLPKADYLVCHNLNINLTNTVREKYKLDRKIGNTIVIAYIGSISYEEQCLKLINLVNRDKRFKFYFYGNENTSKKISEHVKLLDNSRIVMKGAFEPSEKEKIYIESDLVFNCYGNDKMLVKYAISNKHYDASLYHKPLLVSPNTIMAELAGEFAYALDLDILTGLDGLYNWYFNLNEKGYNLYVEKVIENAIRDNGDMKKVIKETIMKL